MTIKRLLVSFFLVALSGCSQSDEMVRSDQSVTGNAQDSSVASKINPSFDCAKASTNIEKMICSDPNLSKLDYNLNALYKEKRSILNGLEADALISTQKRWISNRNSCSDVICLKTSYESRLSQIDSDFSSESADEMAREADELARFKGEQQERENSYNASQSQGSIPIAVSVETDFKIDENGTDEYRDVYIKSLVDNVKINDVILNRGNCNMNLLHKGRMPFNLVYGQRTWDRAWDNSSGRYCSVSEVLVKTDKGSFTFNF
jgi:uncharacterized protein